MTAQQEDPQTLEYDEPGAPVDDYDRGEELPARPRRRLLSPLTATLVAALTAACGFIAGVEVQKGQTSSSSSALPSGIASRIGALRSRFGASGSSAAGLLGGGGSFAGGAAGLLAAGGAGGGVTSGEVAYLRGTTLYVTDSEGNTVKVQAAGSKVTKTVSTDAHSIHPGDTVLVRGSRAKDGSIEASSISISSSEGGNTAAGGSSGNGSGATPALFGAGG